MGRAEPCALPQWKEWAVTMSPTLCPWQRFTQSMKLDGEMERLTLEHGTMLGPPTEEERAEEAAKKKLTNKVGQEGTAGPGWHSGWPLADSPSWFLDHLWHKAQSLWNCGQCGALLEFSKSALKTLSPTAVPAVVFEILLVFSAVSSSGTTSASPLQSQSSRGHSLSWATHIFCLLAFPAA